MKQIIKILFMALLCIGCNSPNLPKEEESKVEKKQASQKSNTKSELIVRFKKGTSVQKATNIIEANNMLVIKVYKSISKSSNMPMLHIGSSMDIKMMKRIVKGISSISSASENSKRRMF
ncbi:MAG: hypothetical protein HF962_03465 [Sulfurovum sp.]|nr:hypothetical protein [Sulfurovum sp.]